MDGVYRNPATGDTLPLDEAVKYKLITGEILDTKRKTEEKILDSTNIVARTMNDETDRDEQTHESSLHVSLCSSYEALTSFIFRWCFIEIFL